LLSQLLGFPRHLSQHVGGFIITQDPLLEMVPVENAAMADRTVIQWDKTDLEALGLMKVDILALGMLTAIRKTIDYINQLNPNQLNPNQSNTNQQNTKPLNKQQLNHGQSGRGKFSMADIPREDDANVYRMLQQADSVGLFQVESRAQMNMLPRLKPEKYYDLVVQVAIVRPGPIHGDMVHPYLKRKNGEEAPDVPLKELEPILARTFGVPIFQEQVIAMAMVGAGFNAEEAEELRRSMASWKKQGHMGSLRHKMSANLLAKGITQEYVDRICRQIEGFGEYGFPESHAASFALLAYISAWLKYYYPAAFCCGLLNSQPMGFYQPWQLIQDAQRHGVTVLPVDINKSHWDYSLEPCTEEKSSTKQEPLTRQEHLTRQKPSAKQKSLARKGPTTNKVTPAQEAALRCGFRSVKGLSQAAAEAIIEQRPSSGYQSVAEVMQRSQLQRDDLEKLASANAFACLGKHRYQQRWDVSAHGFYQNLFYQHFFYQQLSASQQLTAPSRIESIFEDHSNTGVILNDHPLAWLRDQAALDDCVQASSLHTIQPNQEIFVAGVVVNRQRPGTSSGVTFVTLEDETGSVNVVVWLQTALRQMETLVKARLLKIYGKVEKDAGGAVIHLIAYRLIDITAELNQLEAKSRDFH
jgi:error-prone DNA polymerase